MTEARRRNYEACKQYRVGSHRDGVDHAAPLPVYWLSILFTSIQNAACTQPAKVAFMPSAQRSLIFVLWGEHFDELAAVTFVTLWREAGLPVKVVGLSRQPAGGAHGLRLLHDLTVEEATRLIDFMRVLVIPCSRVGGQLLTNDPRIRPFVHHACKHHALLFSTPVGLEVLATVYADFRNTCHATLMPPAEDLVDFVVKFSQQLLAGDMLEMKVQFLQR